MVLELDETCLLLLCVSVDKRRLCSKLLSMRMLRFQTILAAIYSLDWIRE